MNGRSFAAVVAATAVRSAYKGVAIASHSAAPSRSKLEQIGTKGVIADHITHTHTHLRTTTRGS